MHPRQIQNRIDLAHQMIGRNNLIEMELIEQLAFDRPSAAPSSQAPAAQCAAGTAPLFAVNSNRHLQQNLPEAAVSRCSKMPRGDPY
jgi:hypothetical protein